MLSYQPVASKRMKHQSLQLALLGSAWTSDAQIPIKFLTEGSNAVSPQSTWDMSPPANEPLEIPLALVPLDAFSSAGVNWGPHESNLETVADGLEHLAIPGIYVFMIPSIAKHLHTQMLLQHSKSKPVLGASLSSLSSNPSLW